MTDYHIHIGQFDKVYYYADRVFSALKACGVEEVWFSSTTSCIFFKECPALENNPELQAAAPSAKDLYDGIFEEVGNALCAAKETGIKANALYWCLPDMHKALGLSVENVMKNFPYEGFKIHPFAQRWNLSDSFTVAFAEEIFSYAEKNGKRILIHCGEDAICSPLLFEKQIAGHPGAVVQLAHCRPLKETLYMLKNYPNTFCDTAFAERLEIEKINEAGFPERILYGSDFPVTHYKKIWPESDPTQEELAEFLKDYRNNGGNLYEM